jgi:hypothetical protein
VNRLGERANQLELGHMHALERTRQVAAQPARLDRVQDVALELHAVEDEDKPQRAQAHGGASARERA